MFANYTIKFRLTAIIIIMFSLIVMVGGIGLYGMVTSTKEADMLMSEHVRPAILLGQIRFLQAENRSQVLLGLQHDPEGPFAKMHDHPLDLHVENIRKNGEKVAELLETYEKRAMDDPREIELFKKVKDARAALQAEGLRPARELLLKGEFHNANGIVLTKVNPLFRAAAEAGTELEAHILKAAEEEQASHERHFKNTLMLAGVLVLFGLTMVVVMGGLLMRSIVRPLDGIVDHFSTIAKGDLSQRVDISGDNEITFVQKGLAKLQQDLVEMIGEIRKSAEVMTKSAARLQEEMVLVANNSDSQQRGGQDVAAAMQEMTVSVGEVARSTESASEAARSSSELAHEGSHQVEHTMAVTREVVAVMDASSATMRSLQDSVNKIGAVTSVIREVADQTNLLALNAAIEAARAGEQGRGFAVVADEVRKLAERTATSTADIARIVAEVRQSSDHAVNSMHQAQGKIELVQESARQSNDSLGKTLSAAETVSSIAEQIAGASNEQASAATSVAQSMESISGLIADTHERIREVREESDALANAAQHMHQLVSRFRV